MKQFIYSIIVLWALTSCIEEFKASVSSGYEDLLVVEGEITEGTSTFYLSKNFSLDEERLPEDYNDITATLIIVGDNGYKSSPATNPSKGVFEVEVGQLEDNVSYGIEITYNGDTYQSTLSKPLHTPEIEEVSWRQPVNEGDVSVHVSTSSNSDQAQYFLWDYKEDWEFTANFYVTYFWTPEGDYDDFSAPEYYCWNKASNKEILVGSTESLKENRISEQKIYSISITDKRLSLLYSTLVTQRAISKGAYEFYQNKIKVNKEMGGLFTPQPSDIGGNIECITNPDKKVIGYVESIKNFTEKRIFIERSEITRPRDLSCEVISDDVRKEQKLTYEDFYNMGYRLLERPFSGSADWSIASCAHCTENGGSKEKPDFWPNNHK